MSKLFWMRFNRFRFSDACLRKTPKASNNLSKYCSMISLFAMKFHQLKLRWCRCEFVDRENVSFANCKSQIMLKAFSDVQFIVIQFSCKWFASWFSIFHFSPFPNERQWTGHGHTAVSTTICSWVMKDFQPSSYQPSWGEGT